MANRLIHLESDYQYILGQWQGNIMNLQASFSENEWCKHDLKVIAKELVNTAKLFAVQQGLGGINQIKDYSVNGRAVYINRKKRNTGTLIRSIKAKPEGNTVLFWNDADLGRGYYAGHIEYGFHHWKDHHPVPARPFMRPAFQAVARASRGQLQGTLAAFLRGGLTQNTTALFGTPRSGSKLRAFYDQPVKGKSGLGSGLKTVSGLKGKQNAQGNWSKALQQMRDKGTIRRDGNTKGFINNNFLGKSSPPHQFNSIKTISRNDSVSKRVANYEKNSGSSQTAQKYASEVKQKQDSIRTGTSLGHKPIEGKSEGVKRWEQGRQQSRTNVFAQLYGRN